MKLTIIIPVYNEKETIAELLEKVDKVVFPNYEKEIVIVDDYSTDGTREYLEGQKEKYIVLFHKTNQGKGSAIRKGLSAATGDYVVIQDADLEYDPSDLQTLLHKIDTEKLMVVYGSRRLNKKNTQYSGLSYYIGGMFLTALTNILYQQRITDEPTCYKMFKTSFLRSLPLQGQRFEFCPEVTALTGLEGIKITEVPISYYPRPASEGKKIQWVDGLHAIAVLLWYRLGLYKISNLGWMNTVMDFIKKNSLPLLLVILAGINLIIFHNLYGFHPNNDTESFIWTIERFRGIEEAQFHPNRYLNPLYPILGATIFRFFTPAHSIIVSNIVFYFGIILLTYGAIRRMFESKAMGFFTALGIIPSYALIRYGLTQVQDIGGYFWFILTVYTSVRWWKERRDIWLWIGGLGVGLGMLTKESGAMGALFAGILFLASSISWKEKIHTFFKFSALPFVVLLANQYHGRVIGYSSWEWVVWNWKTFNHDYTLFKWFGVNATTFNITWIAVVIGLYYLIKNWKSIDRNVKIYLLAIIPGSISYFGWPIFISRTVFISVWLIMPLAVFGLIQLAQKNKKLRAVSICLGIAMLIVPFILQSTIRYGRLFGIIEECNKNIVCSWNYFWEHRDTFSTQQ